jgi:hypothetical protein
LGGVADGPGCQLWTQDRPLASICGGISSELASAWRYTYWLECLIVSILDESGSGVGSSQVAHKKHHLEVWIALFNLVLTCLIENLQTLAAILRDYTATTGEKHAFRPADAILRPLVLSSNLSSITLPASSVQVCNIRGFLLQPSIVLLLLMNAFSFEISEPGTTVEELRSFY